MYCKIESIKWNHKKIWFCKNIFKRVNNVNWKYVKTLYAMKKVEKQFN